MLAEQDAKKKSPGNAEAEASVASDTQVDTSQPTVPLPPPSSTPPDALCLDIFRELEQMSGEVAEAAASVFGKYNLSKSSRSAPASPVFVGVVASQAALRSKAVKAGLASFPTSILVGGRGSFLLLLLIVSCRTRKQKT